MIELRALKMFSSNSIKNCRKCRNMTRWLRMNVINKMFVRAKKKTKKPNTNI